MLACTPACIGACTPACIGACTPACTPACKKSGGFVQEFVQGFMQGLCKPCKPRSKTPRKLTSYKGASLMSLEIDRYVVS